MSHEHKGGMRGGNTFVDLESNIIPVNCVDRRRWKDHCEISERGGRQLFEREEEEKTKTKRRWTSIIK